MKFKGFQREKKQISCTGALPERKSFVWFITKSDIQRNITLFQAIFPQEHQLILCNI